MTEPIEVPMPTETGADHGAAEGLPRSKQPCPYCKKNREVQQVLDAADEDMAVPVYSCLTCGCEFVASA